MIKTAMNMKKGMDFLGNISKKMKNLNVDKMHEIFESTEWKEMFEHGFDSVNNLVRGVTYDETNSTIKVNVPGYSTATVNVFPKDGGCVVSLNGLDNNTPDLEKVYNIKYPNDKTFDSYIVENGVLRIKLKNKIATNAKIEGLYVSVKNDTDIVQIVSYKEMTVEYYYVDDRDKTIHTTFRSAFDKLFKKFE